MPQSDTKPIPKWTWTQLTDADVTAITFQNVGGTTILVEATNGATAPTSTAGALAYAPGEGENNAGLATLFAGVTGANRVWAWGRDDTSLAAVSHA